MKIVLFILILLAFQTFAQTKSYQSDTSYTLYRTYEQEVKKFPLIEPVYPVLPNGVNAIRDIEYVSYGERKLKLDIFYAQKSYVTKPIIILIHGGGWKTGNKSLTFPLAMKLAEKNYITISVEYRLSPEAIFPAAIIDVNNAIKWAIKNSEKYGIDTSKIIMLGYSAGGQIASLVGFSNNIRDFEDEENYTDITKRIHAIINVDGLVDFLGEGSEEFDEKPDPKNPRAAHQWLGASQIENPELWQKASPINYISENSPPILFVNSSIPRFSAGKNAAIEKFKKYEIRFEVHKLENTPHPFWLFHPWFNETYTIIDNFLVRIFSN